MRRHTLPVLLGLTIITIAPTFAMEPDDLEEKKLPKLILNQDPNSRSNEDNREIYRGQDVFRRREDGSWGFKPNPYILPPEIGYDVIVSKQNSVPKS
ncbi:MAG: hypothetical protein H0X26_05110 [Alphaproteobacteria bacterium]|nr:hypothetical protein [Alphaproteobacteria bacterium]